MIAGSRFLLGKIASPDVVCLIAKHKGSYRKPEYPSIQMVEILQKYLPNVKNKFPDIDFFDTLCRN